MKLLFQIISFFFLLLNSYAYHIAGADFTYEYLGNNTYRLYFTMYRDCSLDGTDLPVAGFDNQIYYFIYANNTKEIYKYAQALKPRVIRKLDPELADRCLVDPSAVCIEVGTYTSIVKLPPRPGGYSIVWQRCCRNTAVTNLLNPQLQGATFIATIPGTETYPNNSSPVFKNFPPLFLCVNKTFLFDHSAYDPDGDSLVYKIGEPLNSVNYQGVAIGYNNPTPDPTLNPVGAPPYIPVTYEQGYSYLQPFGANGVFTIDSATGLLEIFPPQLGVYAVAIDVYEYRNGKLLGKTRREIQFYVEDCLPPGPPLNITHSFPPEIEVKNDTAFFPANYHGCYTAEITANPQPLGNITITPFASYLGLPNLNITVSGNNPTTVQTCWQPTCNFVGQVIPFIILAYDDGACYYYEKVYDTVYIAIKPPDTTQPSADIIPISFSAGDSVWFGDTVCMDFEARADTNLSVEFNFVNTGGKPPTITYTFQSDTLITGTICWEASCSAITNPAWFVVEAKKLNDCGTYTYAKDSIFLFVKLPHNPKPEQQLIVDSATVVKFENNIPVVYVEDSVCYFFSVRDSSPPSNLQFEVEIQDMNNNTYAGNNSPAIQILENYGDTLIKGRACWKVDCDFLNDTLNFIFYTKDYNECVLEYVIINREQVIAISQPTFPTALFWNANNLPVIGDTILLNVKINSCVELKFIDTLNNGNLTIWGEGPLFDGVLPEGNISNNSGIITLSSNFCFTPSCNAIDSLFPVKIIGESEIYCRDNRYDTTNFFIKVVQPVNNPPVLTRDIPSPYNIEIPEKLCYTLTLQDPDDYILYQIGKLNETFDENFGYGSNAVITQIDTIAPNTIKFTICLEPNCYVNDKELLLKFCVGDTTTCNTIHTVCDELLLQVSDCGLVMPNVFTPNGDGINEVFEPISMEGIRDYELYIFDRWGRQLSYTKNVGWKPYKNIPEGVYFYKIIFYFYEGKGPVWKRQQVGSLSLIR